MILGGPKNVSAEEWVKFATPVKDENEKKLDNSYFIDEDKDENENENENDTIQTKYQFHHIYDIRKYQLKKLLSSGVVRNSPNIFHLV